MILWDSQTFTAGARAKGVKPEIITAALGHASAIQSTSPDLPVIFTLNHLAKASGVSHRYLIEVASRTSDPYRDFLVRKREAADGATVSRRYRTICVPDPELKKVQRWLQQNILSKVAPHNASTAYSEGNTVRKAAERHLRARWIVKVDIESFFESIKEPYVASVFERMGYPDLLSFQLGRLCTRLPTTKSRKTIFQRRSTPSREVDRLFTARHAHESAACQPRHAQV